uniref:Venom protein VP3 n=1 Tax=Odontobuthus doriae TaxID=342590 RepID=A0A0U4H7H1_ODODO|nr:venom protein VP3 [Odontobuthus doriae]
MLKKMKILSPRNEEEMTKQCSYLDEMRNCVYNYSRECMTELERSLGDLILSGTADSMKELCKPTNRIHQDFLKQAECINDKYSGTATCFKDAFAAVEALDSIKPETRIQFLCCGINRFRKCVDEYFSSACDKSVAEFIDAILEFILTEFALQICTSYETYKSGCPALPTGNDLKGTYKTNLIGEFLTPFYRE